MAAAALQALLAGLDDAGVGDGPPDREALLEVLDGASGLAEGGVGEAEVADLRAADVIDVLPGDRRARGIGAAEWNAADVPSSELDAVLGLCDALEQGDLDGLEARPEGALLPHVLASSLDPDYSRSLAVGHVFHSLGDEPRWWRFLKTVQCLAWPTKAQLAARLGVPSARLINFRLRLAHAVAQARRLPRLTRAAWRVGRQRVWRRGSGAVREK